MAFTGCQINLNEPNHKFASVGFTNRHPPSSELWFKWRVSLQTEEKSLLWQEKYAGGVSVCVCTDRTNNSEMTQWRYILLIKKPNKQNMSLRKCFKLASHQCDMKIWCRRTESPPRTSGPVLCLSTICVGWEQKIESHSSNKQPTRQRTSG